MRSSMMAGVCLFLVVLALSKNRQKCAIRRCTDGIVQDATNPEGKHSATFGSTVLRLIPGPIRECRQNVGARARQKSGQAANFGGLLWYGTILLLVSLAFVAAFLESSTPERPSGEAGIYAPLIAFFVAVFILVETLVRRNKLGYLAGLFVGVSTLASAYLFVAVGAASHPGDLQFLTSLFFVIGLAFIAVFGALFMFALAWVAGVLFGNGSQGN